MGDITQSAAGLRQSIGGLGKAIKEKKAGQARGVQAERLRQFIPGAEGEIVAADVEAGTISGTQGLKSQQVSVNMQIASLMKVAIDPKRSEEERLQAREAINKITSIQGTMKKLRTGGGTAKIDVKGSDTEYSRGVARVAKQKVESGVWTQAEADQKVLVMLASKGARDILGGKDLSFISDFFKEETGGKPSVKPSKDKTLRKQKKSSFDETIDEL